MERSNTHPVFFALLATAVALLTLALLLVAAFLMGPDRPPVWSGVEPAEAAGPELSGVVARRVISIPYGIDDTLFLSSGGGEVLVTGHGICPDGGQDFQLKLDVTQQSTSVRAKGRTEGTCAGGEQVQWSALAETLGPDTFSPGPAQACGMVVIFGDRQGAVVFNWCKDVLLQ